MFQHSKNMSLRIEYMHQPSETNRLQFRKKFFQNEMQSLVPERFDSCPRRQKTGKK